MSRRRTNSEYEYVGVGAIVFLFLFIGLCVLGLTKGCQERNIPPQEQYQLDSIRDGGNTQYGYSKS